MRARAFTLIELLVVVAVVGVLVGVLLPALRSAQESTRTMVCASNMRQIALASRDYALTNDGLSPALGVPWGKPPFWALVVQQWAEVEGETAADLYKAGSILVCPAADRAHAPAMERTYAINVTGHAGLEGDPDNFDETPAHIRTDRIARPSRTPYFVDSDDAPDISGAPPSSRTPATIDFRQPAHIEHRLGRYHPADSFQVAHFDASVETTDEVPPSWEAPLP